MPVLRRCLLRAALSVVPMAAAAPLAAQQPPAPAARARLYLLGGPALVRTRVTGETDQRAQTTGVLGVRAPVLGRLGVEGEYLHLPFAVGRTRGAERAIAVPPPSRREARAHRVVRGRYSAAPPLAVSRQEPSAPATAGGPRGASG
jgi:hypothetical protein